MTSPKGSAGRQEGLVGRESSEMVAVGAEADMPVGPDYQKRDLADAQLIGCGGGEPPPGVPIAGSRREPDRRLDQRPVAPSPNRAGELPQRIVTRRGSADEEGGVARMSVDEATRALRRWSSDARSNPVGPAPTTRTVSPAATSTRP